MADKTVKLIISAQDQASAALADVANNGDKTSRSLKSSFEGVGTAARGLLVALAPLAAALAGREIVQASLAWEGYENSLKAITGTSAGAADELKYIQETANRLGLDLQSTANAYIQLSASTKGTGVTSAETRAIFEAVSGSMAVLGRSSDQAEGALLAISQMFSKGKVQAEELRGQLGERLPGAFNLFAKSMGVSTEELNKLLETGKVGAAETLPKFAAELMKVYGPGMEDAARSTRAEINRFNSSVFELKLKLGEAGFMDTFSAGIEILSGVLQDDDFNGAFDDLSAAINRLKDDMGGTKGVIDAIVKVFEVLALGVQTTLVPIQLAGDLLGATFAAMAAAAEGDLKGAWAILQDPTPGDNFRKNMAGLEEAAARVSGAIDNQGDASTQSAKDLQALEDAAKSALDPLGLLGKNVDAVVVATDKAAPSTKELEKAAAAAAKEIENEKKAAETLNLKLLELASNETIKSMEFAASINIAGIEADTKRIEASFQSINTAIESSGTTLSSFWNLLGSGELNGLDKLDLKDQIEAEEKRRQSAFDQQKILTDQQIEMNERRLESLRNGGSMITIDGQGLAPELEAFMFKILQNIQTRVAGDYGAYLLGI